MLTEAPINHRDFLAAQATLEAELVKVVGGGIVKTIAADQVGGIIVGMTCVGCMTRLERKYGTPSSVHVQKLITALQGRFERPADFPMYTTRYNCAIQRPQCA